MHTYFLSDLHLSPEKPQITQAFFDFLRNTAITAEKVYILGDLFEYWIGDDASTMLNADPVLEAMAALSSIVDCAFIAGNRDFLVREEFTHRTGFKILSDETVISLYGKPTLLLHGDSLCSDDLAHQQFRQEMMTNQAFCDAFLSLSIPERVEQAKQARMQSHKHKSEINMTIMDVSEGTVLNAFHNNNVKQIIHGHTHRQNIHTYEDGQLIRYVLGDWNLTSSIMRVDANEIKITNLKI